MNKLQWIVIGAGAALFFVLYFGCDTQNDTFKAIEQSRALSTEATDLNSLIAAAAPTLSAAQATEARDLEQKLENSTSDSTKVEVLKQLSGKWYEWQQPAIAGTYAQNVAELLNDEKSWSVAGTTYAICLQTSQDEPTRSYCMNRAVKAFENAISINPGNTAHRVNLALCYTEILPQGEPMKGILMLRELNQQEPDNVLVLNSLARLAIKTGQFDRAKERLERVVTLESNNVNAVCMLSQVYTELKETDKATEFTKRCETISNQQ